jgi:two-component system, cell cycle sensor histidine kinase and response regulator CckA
LRPLMGDDVEVVISPRSSTAVVEGDPVQLDQVILNLAVNARDAMPKGGKLILETATTYLDETMATQHAPLTAGKYVQLTVSDTGTGMDPATAARIFEPFFTTKEVGKGTGLGLAMVYGIVRQINGHILVYSEPGHGTTFKIYLPSAEEKIGLPAAGKNEILPRRRPNATILLVEDDEMMRMLTKQLLEDHGYNVIEASDGTSALNSEIGGGKHIDVLLTDVVMRGISGPELVRQLANTRPKTKVIFMSGYTGELLSEHDIFQAGTRFLEKPFSRTALLTIVDAALEEAE